MSEPSPPPPAIELRDVSLRYDDVSDVVRGLSLAIAAGETFVLVGPSGCGKTSTLRMINRLVDPTEGAVLVQGRDVREHDAAELRRGIGYVLQDAGLFAHYTVRRNVGLVPELLGWPAERVRARVDELLALVGVAPEAFGERYPRELSGGQRQRVGIARALAADPPIVLLDEPFSALDPITRERLQDEFRALAQKLRRTYVLVTHDMVEAVRLGDRLAVLREGRLVQCDTPAAVVRRPADDFVASLLGRHWYQLRLMTTAALEACARSEGLDAAGTSRWIDAPPAASVWQTLERMEHARAALARVACADGVARFFSRAALVEGAENAAR